MRERTVQPQERAFEGKLTLSDEEANANTAHVEPIQPILDLPRSLLRRHPPLVPLPFQHALSDGGDRWVVAVLDVLEHLRELFVVRIELWREGGGGNVGQGVKSVSCEVRSRREMRPLPAHLFSMGIRIRLPLGTDAVGPSTPVAAIPYVEAGPYSFRLMGFGVASGSGGKVDEADDAAARSSVGSGGGEQVMSSYGGRSHGETRDVRRE